MKKSLIALAVAGVVSAPAFAATSNVDVYGKLHMSASYFNDGLGKDLQFSSNASRIGFKGAEDLGGGLSAIWQIESGVNLDEQNGTLASRNSFVGLKGGFGTVLAGNHDTPLKLVGRAVDLFGDTMADSRNVMGGGSDTRAQNVVAYISPDFTGMTFAAAYSTEFSGANGTEGDSIDSSVYNLNATYTNGPLFLGVGYGDGDGHETLGLGAHWRLAGGYTFGNFKVVGQYDSLEGDGVIADDYDAWMVGGAYTMGNVVFKANYMEGEIDGCNIAGCDKEQWTIGADYNLSKRTSVYALYADGQNVTMGGGAGSSDRVPGFDPLGGDADVSVISLGMVHAF
jgi:predicted porin